MQTHRTVLVKKDKVEKVYCNMCAAEIGEFSKGRKKDYLHIEKTWGYGSDMDGESHSIDLCEDCYKEIIKKFKINIKV